MKNRFLKTTIILMIGGCITKILGMIIKIIMTRLVTTEALGLFMMLSPTLILIINLSQAGLPSALAKLIADEDKSTKKLLFSLIPILIIINIILMVIIFILAPYVTNNLLKSKDLYLGMISIALLIPFTSISSIIRSYFFGKSNAFPLTISNIIELVTKLLIYTFYLPIIKDKPISYIICFLILTSIISEIASIVTMLIFLPKNITIQKKDFIPKMSYVRSSLTISIPNTTSRLIGSIGYFFEPIILTNTLKYIGYSTKYITYDYGIINGYVIPLIMMPSFLTTAISQALLPALSKEYAKNNLKAIKRKLKFAIFLSMLIGLFSTFLFISVPELLLRFIYKTNKGVNFLRVLAPIFFIEYLESPLSVTLEAMGKSTIDMLGILIGTIVKTIALLFFSLFQIGLWSLVIATSLSIITRTTYYFIKINKFLN